MKEQIPILILWACKLICWKLVIKSKAPPEDKSEYMFKNWKFPELTLKKKQFFD